MTHELTSFASLRSGDDACGFFKDTSEFLAMAVPFTLAGLGSDGWVLCLADTNRNKALCDSLAEQGMGPATAERSGRLILPRPETLESLRGAAAAQAGIADLFRAELSREAAGRSGTGWVLIDTAGLLGKDIEPGLLSRLEIGARAFLRKLGLVKLSLYARSLPPEVLNEALTTHPILAVGADCLANTQYVPPGAGPDRAATEFGHRLRSIVRYAGMARALRRSEKQVREMVRTSPVGMIVVRPQDDRVLFANPAAARILGTPRGALRGEPLGFFVPAGREIELAILRPDRSHVAVRCAGTPIEWGGKPAQLVLLWDITAWHQSVQRERVLSAAVDQIGDGIVITRPDGMIEYVNTAFERIAGLKAQQLLGQNAVDLVNAVPSAAVKLPAMKTALRDGRSWEGQIEFERDEGPTCFLSVSVAPVRGENGLAHLVGSVRDITEQVELENRLRRSEKLEAVGQLAGGVAHDFNNLLMVMLAGVEFVREEVGSDSPAQRDLDDIESAARRGAALTKKLLTFSRRQILKPEIIVVNDAVSDLSKMLRRVIPENIELVVRPGSDAGRIKVDPGEFDQILMNLAVNARDAMPDGGLLTISTGSTTLATTDTARMVGAEEVSAGAYSVIQVADTGSGISKENLARIWEPFFTTKRRTSGSGTGLGLASVLGNVRQHCGHIEVESEVGKGTIFRVYFPRLPDHAVETDLDRTRKRLPGGDETILVIEDDPGVRRMVVRELEHLGYQVVEAESAEAAQAGLAESPRKVDLLLTDVLLPGADGRTAARNLAQDQPHLKVVFMSGYPEEQISTHGVLEPGARLLQKPFSAADLARTVREALDAARRT
ncbi:MAG: PAS domain S-box protein [Kiritimatiellaeota bacterium]|nr:PAS domain S-box protein [Kiritimatiellota bacterium]